MRISNETLPNIGNVQPISNSSTAIRNISDSGNKLSAVKGENKGPEHMQMLKDVYGEKRLKQMGFMPCITCESRVYQDGSDDPGVSFKTGQHVSPEASYSAVLSHEMEHVSREQNKAENEQREVISQSVTLHSALCPECGKSYVAGGVTRTTTAGIPKDDAYRTMNKEDQLGAHVDLRL